MKYVLFSNEDRGDYILKDFYKKVALFCTFLFIRHFVKKLPPQKPLQILCKLYR